VQEIPLFDAFRHFDRERIPERVLHAKGAGAHGYFLPTRDLSKITVAHPFQPENLNKKVPVTVRFSTVSGESGSADTVRTFRGFAIKLKTEVGNWDWVFINFPVFSIRDPAKLIGIAHAQARNPETHLFDPDRSWDNFSQNPEMIHQIMMTFSDRGITDGYTFQHAFSVNPFFWINKAGEVRYVKMHVKASKIKWLSDAEGQKLAGTNPDYNTEDLYNSIERGDLPAWTVYIQTMTLEEAEHFRYNVLDATKVWPHKEYPLLEVGKLVLDQNPVNYFAEIEQLAFAPSTLIPGILPSPDPVLQTRMFVYPDTQVYRLGVNMQQLPANKPVCPIANFQRNGFMAFDNQGSRADYPSSSQPRNIQPALFPPSHEVFIGQALSYLSKITYLDFEQPRQLWFSWSPDEKKRFVENVAASLGAVKSLTIVHNQLAVFAAVDKNLARLIAIALKLREVDIQALVIEGGEALAP
jgi:catalase